jgi:biopolymer transport protein ExbD
MRVPTNLRSGSLGFNMTPMIDVVFLLIIFFLVSSHLAKQEVQMKLPLPTAESGQESVQDNTPRLTINVLSDGTMMMLGRRVAESDLALRLRDKLRDAGPGIQVRIRSDRGAPYRFVEPIMLACARTGIWDVSFAVYRSEDVR